MSTVSEPTYCHDYEGSCCWSCHEDRDDYGYPMIELDDGGEVCCSISRAIEASDEG